MDDDLYKEAIEELSSNLEDRIKLHEIKDDYSFNDSLQKKLSNSEIRNQIHVLFSLAHSQDLKQVFIALCKLCDYCKTTFVEFDSGMIKHLKDIVEDQFDLIEQIHNDKKEYLYAHEKPVYVFSLDDKEKFESNEEEEEKEKEQIDIFSSFKQPNSLELQTLNEEEEQINNEEDDEDEYNLKNITKEELKSRVVNLAFHVLALAFDNDSNIGRLCSLGILQLMIDEYYNNDAIIAFSYYTKYSREYRNNLVGFEALSFINEFISTPREDINFNSLCKLGNSLFSFDFYHEIRFEVEFLLTIDIFGFALAIFSSENNEDGVFGGILLEKLCSSFCKFIIDNRIWKAIIEKNKIATFEAKKCCAKALSTLVLLAETSQLTEISSTTDVFNAIYEPEFEPSEDCSKGIVESLIKIASISNTINSPEILAFITEKSDFRDWIDQFYDVTSSPEFVQNMKEEDQIIVQHVNNDILAWLYPPESAE